MEVSGTAQWPTGEGRAVTCLGSGKGATGCEWHRWPRFGTESQCWGCEQPEAAAQGSQAAEGHTVLHWRSPRAQALVLMLLALVTKAAIPWPASASTHQPPVAESMASC